MIAIVVYFGIPNKIYLKHIENNRCVFLDNGTHQTDSFWDMETCEYNCTSLGPLDDVLQWMALDFGEFSPIGG